MAFKTVVMRVIPHAEQRYNTVGDYWQDGETLEFRVSDLGDWRYNFSVLLHEFVEFGIVKHKGISDEAITAFDKAMPDDSPYALDPGFDPAAPYHQEHVLADAVERIVALQMGGTFEEMTVACDRVAQMWVEPHEPQG